MNWLKKLQYDLDAKKSDKVPAGWFTADQIFEANAYSNSHARRIIYDAVKAGLMERKEYRILSGSYLRKVPHYRLKKS
jgi:hypothetical protein